jgi:two-component system, NarL family, nitrate/nitrite response regulator NarL
MDAGFLGTIVIGRNALFRAGLAHVLKAADFHVLASACDASAPILRSLPQGRPLLLVVESGSSFSTTLRQIETFKGRYPMARVAVLAPPERHHLSELLLALRAGANAYFFNVSSCDVFIKSLQLVMLGETILPSAILSLLCNTEDASGGRNGRLANGCASEDHLKGGSCAEGEDDDEGADYDLDPITKTLTKEEDGSAPSLSGRQRIILCCLVEGDSNKTIARKIHISEATVKVHLKVLLRKINVQNRTQAAIWAMNNGFLGLPLNSDWKKSEN